ncbi:MAG TPA: hypothetical protein VG890_04120 [Puia sp.]|nr:hypothetical protein [Puia sp.]
MVNDRKILENGKVKSVTVNNLAGGSYLIRYASESDWYRDKLDVQLAVDLEEGKSVTRTIDVPPYGKGYWVHLAKRAMLILAVGMVLR